MDVSRRELLVGVAGLGAIIAGGIVVTRGPMDDDPDGTDAGESGSEESGPPFDVRTIDAPDGDEGPVRLPESGRATVLNFTRTRCPTSREHLSTLSRARERVDSDVRFLSVVDWRRDPADSDEEVADWWDQTDGNWYLGADDDGDLNEYYDVQGFPTTVVLDGEGEIRWRAAGETTSDAVVDGVESALEAEADRSTS